MTLAFAYGPIMPATMIGKYRTNVNPGTNATSLFRLRRIQVPARFTTFPVWFPSHERKKRPKHGNNRFAGTQCANSNRISTALELTEIWLIVVVLCETLCSRILVMACYGYCSWTWDGNQWSGPVSNCYPTNGSTCMCPSAPAAPSQPPRVGTMVSLPCQASYASKTAKKKAKK